MQVVKPSKDDFIEWQEKPLTAAGVEQFRAGTDTRFTQGFPLTLATIFRQSEFDWLARLKVDMHDLLHAEQEYSYFAPLEIGEEPTVRTWVSDFKERKGKQFSLAIVELTSDVTCAREKKMTAVTTFVVKSLNGERS